MYWFIDLSTSRWTLRDLRRFRFVHSQSRILSQSAVRSETVCRWSLRKRVDGLSMVVDGCRHLRNHRQESTTLDKCRHAYVTQSSTTVDKPSTTINNPRQPATLRTRRPRQPSTSVDKCRHPYVTTVDTLRNWQSRLISLIQSRALLILFLFFSSSINLTTFLVEIFDIEILEVDIVKREA